MEIRVLKGWEECKEVWEKLSPHSRLDDCWEFREAYARGEAARPYFIVAFEDSNTATALLALQQTQEEQAEVFGGAATDSNYILGKSTAEINQLLFQAVPAPANLWPLEYAYTDGKKVSEPDDFLYQLDLSSFKNIEDYLRGMWSNDSRKTLQKQFRKLESAYHIVSHYNREEDLEMLFSLNVAMFGDRSIFVRKPYRKQVFRDFFHRFPSELISIEVNGETQAVAYAIAYNGTYTGMNLGANHAIRNLGKYLHCTQISRAIALGCTTYDVGKSDSGGWKEAFKFTPIPQYRFIRVK